MNKNKSETRYTIYNTQCTCYRNMQTNTNEKLKEPCCAINKSIANTDYDMAIEIHSTCFTCKLDTHFKRQRQCTQI